MIRRVTLCVVLVAVCPTAVWAQNDDDAQIRAAIRRGVQFLKSQQNDDGSWTHLGHDLGITALVGLALVENGVPVNDRVIQNALSVVRGTAPSNTFTYDISLAILFLSRVGASSDKALIQELGTRLAGGQLTTGGWTYVCPLVPQSAKPASVSNSPRPGTAADKRPGRLTTGMMRMGGFGDNSNTQFAVLGIWVAGRAGLDVRETMADVDRRFRSTQSPTGGWGYAGGGESDAMTCAGLMSLALAKGHKILENQMANRKPGEGGADKRKADADPQLERGLKRVELYANTMGPGSTLYFMWSIERVAVALGLNRLGNIDWYKRGAATLVEAQQRDGSWVSNRTALPDTSFALLFLHRSNLTQGMPQLITGRSGGSENQMRSGSLEDLVRSVKPAEKPDEKPEQK
jgi:hypothetical protein